MLEGKPISSSELLSDLPDDVRQKVERLTNILEQMIERDMESYSRGESDISAAEIAEMIDSFIRSLESTGHSSPVYSAPDLIEQAVERARERVSEKSGINRERADEYAEAIKKVAEKLREGFNSPKFQQKLIESLDPSKLSPEDWRRIIDKLMDTKLGGRGAGGGILDTLRAKLLVSPQFRFYLKEYLRDLRVAPSERESFHPIGKRIDPRRTFMESSRTGLPLLVFRKPIVKPRTKEDVVFIYDVSGSMSSYFALIAAAAQALSDLGLNVKVWYAEEGAMKAVSRDFIRELERFGGGGTNLADATAEVLAHEDLRHSVVILYSDLYEGADEKRFIENMERINSRAEKAAVFVTECTKENGPVRRSLKERGIYVKCNVNTPRAFLEGIKELKYHIKKVAVVV